jgi:hypothetical protein
MLRSNDRLDPPHDRARVAAKDVHLHAFFEQGDPLSPMRSVEFGQSFIDRACATVEVANPSLLGNPRQHDIDKVIVVRALLTPRDHIEGDLHRAFQLSYRLIKVEHIVGFQPAGKLDDRAPFEAGRFGCPKEPSSLKPRAVLPRPGRT